MIKILNRHTLGIVKYEIDENNSSIFLQLIPSAKTNMYARKYFNSLHDKPMQRFMDIICLEWLKRAIKINSKGFPYLVNNKLNTIAFDRNESTNIAVIVDLVGKIHTKLEIDMIKKAEDKHSNRRMQKELI